MTHWLHAPAVPRRAHASRGPRVLRRRRARAAADVDGRHRDRAHGLDAVRLVRARRRGCPRSTSSRRRCARRSWRGWWTGTGRRGSCGPPSRSPPSGSSGSSSPRTSEAHARSGCTSPRSSPAPASGRSGRWSGPAGPALLGDDPHRMHTAYSLESALDELVFVVGPVLATVLATGVAPTAGLIVPLVAMLVGGYWFLSLRRTEPPSAPVGSPRPRGRCCASPAWWCWPSSSSRWARSSAPPTSSTVAFAEESGSKGVGRRHPRGLRARLADLRAAVRHAARGSGPSTCGSPPGWSLLAVGVCFVLPRAVARRARRRDVRRRVRDRADPHQRERSGAGAGARASG